MKQNKFKFLSRLMSIALISSVVISSCTKNYENYNTNPYGVENEEMQRDGYDVRASILGMSNGVISLDVNTTQFTECLLGGPMAGYLADANANFNETISNYNPKDDWTRVFLYSDKIIPVIYSNYRQLHHITKDPIICAVADIIKVAAMHRVTDTYGPIPYSQIKEDGKLKVPYDSQEKVYSTMLNELTNAVNVLTENRTNNFAPQADIIYGGVVDKWIKFANSLKLRLAMRISYASPELSRKMAEEAVSHVVGVMESNEDNAFLSSANFGPSGNPINVAVKYNMGNATTGGDSHAAADIICYMNGFNDPRRAAYFTKSEWEDIEYIGLRHGIIIPSHKDIGYKYSGVKISNDSPLYWMNAAEVAFLRAEAAGVFGYDMKGDAKDFYEKGIRLSFEQWGAGSADAYIRNSTSTPDSYKDPSDSNPYGSFSSITIAWEEGADKEAMQERIITQKWIANWLLGNEAWADWRRTGYPHLIPASKWGNKSNGMVDSETGARRMKYPSDEYVNNPDNINAALSEYLNGPDQMATRLWFDCKESSN